MTQPQSHKFLRIVVLGAEKTGKTSLVNQFLYGNHIPTLNKNIQRAYSHMFVGEDGTKVTMEIVDVGNKRPMSQICQGDAFVLVYSADEVQSFDLVGEMASAIKGSMVNGEMVPLMVVKNKVDLLPAAERARVSQVVQEMTIRAEWDCDYVEASAKDNINVDMIWYSITDRVLNTKPGAATSKERQKLLGKSQTRRATLSLFSFAHTPHKSVQMPRKSLPALFSSLLRRASLRNSEEDKEASPPKSRSASPIPCCVLPKQISVDEEVLPKEEPSHAHKCGSAVEIAEDSFSESRGRKFGKIRSPIPRIVTTDYAEDTEGSNSPLDSPGLLSLQVTSSDKESGIGSPRSIKTSSSSKSLTSTKNFMLGTSIDLPKMPRKPLPYKPPMDPKMFNREDQMIPLAYKKSFSSAQKQKVDPPKSPSKTLRYTNSEEKVVNTKFYQALTQRQSRCHSFTNLKINEAEMKSPQRKRSNTFSDNSKRS